MLHFRELAIMSYYTFQISKTTNATKFLFTVLKDFYVVGVIGYIRNYMYEYSTEHFRLVLQIIGFVHYFLAKMSYYTFQISKTTNATKFLFTELKDLYVVGVIGYIRSHMYEYSTEHFRLVL